MSNIPQIIQDVITNTNMPHLVRETRDEVRRAILWYHLQGKFRGDVKTISVTPETRDGNTLLIPHGAMPQFRTLVTSLLCDAVTTPVCGNNMVVSTSVPSPCAINVVYDAGGMIHIRSPMLSRGKVTLTGYFTPSVNPLEATDSWIVAQHPDYITVRATSRLLHLKGDLEAAGRYSEEISTNVANLHMDYRYEH